MRGNAVLAVLRYPTATFQVKTVTPLGDKSQRGLPQCELDGDLTLHGTSQPIQVIADVEEQNGWTHLRGKFSLLQTQFNMRPYTPGLGAVGVSNKLQVYGDFWVAKEKQTSPPPTESK
jgi:polyisoprenoid-binding protein YceI